jgi:TetR/AcrR family tetracycline transcriptional repressor
MSRRKQALEAEKRPRLSREQLVKTALQIVDRDGLEGLSMRKLGAELGVDPMAAYYYFPNKGALLDGLVEAVVTELDLTLDRAQPWQDRLRLIAHAYRNVLRRHPNALPVISTRPVFTRASLHSMEIILQTLCDAGFTPNEAIDITGSLGPFVIGYTLAEVGRPPGGVEDISSEEIIENFKSLPPDEFPILSQGLYEGRTYDSDLPFDLGLDILQKGLEQRLKEKIL